jgi:hypothetical protein
MGVVLVTFAQGTYGIDSSTSTIDDAQAFRDGSRFHIRYSAGAATDPGNPSHGLNAGKLFRDNELAKILGSGQDFLANDEWSNARTTEGAAAAEEDAPVTLRFWRAKGLHIGATIMLNLDTGWDPNNLAGVEAYIDRTNKIWGGEYLADGFYAGIPVLRVLGRSGRCRHGWIPEGASFSFPSQTAIDPHYAPPARTNWDLWSPTPSQVRPAMDFLLNALGADHGMESVIWQDRNKRCNGLADENIVLIGGNLGTHLEAAGQLPQRGLTSASTRGVLIGGATLWQDQPVPALIARGTGQFFGLLTGPKQSHGGADAQHGGVPGERDNVRILQQRLIVLGFVPGISDPNSSWADGLFQQPTANAVATFQHQHMPGTTFFGQVWWDDWTTLFSVLGGN